MQMKSSQRRRQKVGLQERISLHGNPNAELANQRIRELYAGNESLRAFLMPQITGRQEDRLTLVLQAYEGASDAAGEGVGAGGEGGGGGNGVG
eukprot:7026283-Prymnesium_polylepis.1